MRHTVSNGKMMFMAFAVMIAVLTVVTVAVQTDYEDSDARAEPPPVIDTNDKPYVGDVEVRNKMEVKGIYSGNVNLISSDGGTIYASLSFNNASKFAVYANSGSPYIVSLNPGTTFVYVTIISGSIMLGNDAIGFTGNLKYNSDSMDFYDISGAVVSIENSNMVLSGGMSAASGVGMNVESVISTTGHNKYTGNENIAVSGILGNDDLKNYFEVVKNNDGSYILRGTLAYIYRDGTSSVGTLFDLVVGDKNDYTHAVVLGTSGTIEESDSVIGLGGGQYLVCLDSSGSSIVVDGVKIDFSGLDMGAPNQISSSSITGSTGMIKINNDVVAGDLTIGSSATVIVNENATFDTNSSSHLTVLGTLDVKGNSDFSNSSSFTCTAGALKGNIAVEGKLIISNSYTGSNIEGVYYTSNRFVIYTALSEALSKSNKVYVSASYYISDSITIPKDHEIVVSGNMYIDEGVTVTNKGTVTSSGGITISISGKFLNTSGVLNNNGYLMAYGLFSNNGAFNSKTFADVSYYNNVTTRLASLSVILDNVSAGDSLVLIRDTIVNNNATIPKNVSLSTNSWKLTVDKKVTLIVNGELNVVTAMQIDGTMKVFGNVSVKDRGSVTASGEVNIAGKMVISTSATMDNIIITGNLDSTGTVNIKKRVQIGQAPNSLPYSNPVKISGNINIGSDTLVIVYGSGFNVDDNFKVRTKTTFLFNNLVYVTEYASGTNVNLEMLIPKILGSGFAKWLDAKGVAVEDGRSVGVYDELYADVVTDMYKVTFVVNNGIEWLLDGISYHNGGDFEIPYGFHSLEINVLDGYWGHPSINMIVGDHRTIISQNKDFLLSVDSKFKVQGVYAINENEGNQLAIILIAVIALTVIAIVLMSFLLTRKNKLNNVIKGPKDRI